MNTDDRQQALQALKLAALEAEPAATALVEEAAAATNGDIVRPSTRFKSDASIAEKLERFRRQRSPKYRLERFNDALRYTVVYSAGRYWRGYRELVGQLSARGFAVVADPGGWRRGYTGINLTVADPQGRLFEVQVHTPDSLAAAEATHGLYEQQRTLPRGSQEWLALGASMTAIFDGAPRPPGVPEIP